jgi:trimeric autotransporter adhesin
MSTCRMQATFITAAMVTTVAAQPCVPGWHSVAGGPNGAVRTLAVTTENGRTALFAGGLFSSAGGIPTGALARWDGGAWSRVGTEFITSPILTLIEFDDGSGPALYVGGHNVALGANPAVTGILRWSGTQWEIAGQALNGTVRCLAVHDDGQGPALYAGGYFWSPPYGQQGPRNLMKLEQGTWVPVGGGVNDDIGSMASFNDGGGRSLWVNGQNTAPAAFMTRWDGTQWHDVRGSHYYLNGNLSIFDSGTGPRLHLGGYSGFEPIVRGVFRWDGSDWINLGVVTNSVPRRAVAWDDGAGPALYVGGEFQGIIGVPSTQIVARWDGTIWSGTGAEVLHEGGVAALIPFDDGSGPALYAGGTFNVHAPTRYLVRYTTCNHSGPCYANCDGSTALPSLNIDDFICYINEFASGLTLPHAQQVASYANCDSSTIAPALNVDDFTCFINQYGAGCP